MKYCTFFSLKVHFVTVRPSFEPVKIFCIPILSPGIALEFLQEVAAHITQIILFGADGSE